MINSSNLQTVTPYLEKNGKLTFLSLLPYWLFALFTLALSFSFLGMRLATGSDNARQEPGEQSLSPLGLIIKVISTQSTGLLDGDNVVEIEGYSLNYWLNNLFNDQINRPNWQQGNTIDYSILRNNRVLHVSVLLIPYPLKQVLILNWSTLLFVIISQVIIGAVFIFNPHEAATKALFIWAFSLSHTYVWALGLQVSDFTNSLSFGIYQAATGILWFVFWGAFLHFALSFPQTHSLVRKFPSLRVWTYLLPFLLSAFYLLFSGSAFNAMDWLKRWTESEWVVGAIVTFLWLFILLEGYRNRFSPTEKKKVRWIFLSGLICGVLGLFFFLFPASIFKQSIIPGNLLGLILIPFPICLAISVYRHQLFDIDIIIRRTLLYSSLTIFLGLSFFVGILIIQNLFQTITGQSNQLAVVFSTVGIASMANPLRKWLQGVIDRRFYRNRYDSERALALFVAGARDEVDLSHLSSQLSSIVFDSLQPMYLSIWLKKASPGKSKLDEAWQMLLDRRDMDGE